jgi:hypothetical protein
VQKREACLLAKFNTVGRRLDLIENMSTTSTTSLASVSNSRPALDSKADEEDDCLFLGPTSQEVSFLSYYCPSQNPSVDDCGTYQDQVPVENLSMKAKAYAIRRELSGPDSISPPSRNSCQPSDFQSCSCLVRDSSKSYVTFPKSSHFKSALSFINSQLVDDQLASNKAFNLVKTNLAFSPFPGKVRTKYLELHNVTLGKSQHIYDKTFSNPLDAEGSDGLRLSQTDYSRSENNLRGVAAALQNAEHFLAAAGALLKDKGEEFDYLRSFLPQVDRCLCTSQYLKSRHYY